MTRCREAGDGAFDLSDMLSTVVPILNDLHTILNKPYTPVCWLIHNYFKKKKRERERERQKERKTERKKERKKERKTERKKQIKTEK